MGITRVANVTGLDRIGIPVVMVVPAQLALAVGVPGQGPRPRRGQGVGADGVGRELARRAHRAAVALAQLRGAALHATRWSTWPRSPGLTRAASTATSPLLWIEGRELLADEPVWVPYETGPHRLHPARCRRAAAAFRISSNGLASGNHLLEAISHGHLRGRRARRHARCGACGRTSETARDPRRPATRSTTPDCREVLERYRARRRRRRRLGDDERRRASPAF